MTWNSGSQQVIDSALQFVVSCPHLFYLLQLIILSVCSEAWLIKGEREKKNLTQHIINSYLIRR